MAWPPVVVFLLVLLLTVAVVLPCCIVLCFKCNPHWKYNPLTWRWHWPRAGGQRVDVVDFQQPLRGAGADKV
jgi:hypothetical protein